MYEHEMLVADVCRSPYTLEDIADFVATIRKVWVERGRLLEYEQVLVSRA
jgi:hypothetical protein